MNEDLPVDNLINSVGIFINNNLPIMDIELITLIKEKLTKVYKNTTLDHEALTIGFLLANNIDLETAVRIDYHIDTVFDYWLNE